MTEVHSAAQDLQERLDRAIEWREQLQQKVKDRQAELDALVAKVPKRPREKKIELEEKIAALERKRTITSIALAEEREILKQINKLERVKREVDAFDAHDKQIKDKKAQVAELRETLKAVRDDVDVLWSEMAVTRVAERVGTTKERLVGMKVVFPKEKLGSIIGKQGKNVKQLQEKDSVTVNVGKEGELRIHGSPEALEAAADDLHRVISSKEESIEVSPALASYLTSKNVTALKDLRSRHADVYFSVLRKSCSIPVRGLPEDIDRLRKELTAFPLSKKEFELPSNECSHIVGKDGSTVDDLVAAHQVAIDVERKEDKVSKVTVCGPTANVAAAVESIMKLAAEVRETTNLVKVQAITKSVLLHNGGAGIQAIAKKVKDASDGGYVSVSFDGDHVAVKGRAMVLANATSIVEEEIRMVESSIVRLDADPAVIPAIIGKGGETIKKLTEGKDAIVEVDRKRGVVEICGLGKDNVDSVVKAVNDVIAANLVERIVLDASSYKEQSGDLIRMRSKTIGAICLVTCDDDRCEIVLRGEEEKVKEASALVKEFLASNYKEEVSVTAEDLRLLLNGGKESKLVEIATEFDVKLHSHRESNMVEVRGEKAKVESAVKALNQFIFGGDGYSLAKIVLNAQLLGVVIGKGGKNKAELQEKYPGVSIAVDGAKNVITLRGPEKEVDGCRVEIAKLVALAQVVQHIEITEKQYQHLNKNNTVRLVMREVPALVTLSKTEVTVRGFVADVRDAVALVNNSIHNKYESRLVLPHGMFEKVQGAFKDPSHLDRIMKASDASVVLDSSDGSIVFKGKRDQVKKAKLEVFKCLDFLLSPSFGRLELQSALLSLIGKVPVLSDVSALSGAAVQIDRDTGCVLVFSADAECVGKAMDMLKAKVGNASELYFELVLDRSEDWIVSSIIGKGGASINKLRKETKCTIDVDSKSNKITVKGEDAESVQGARTKLDDLVDKQRRECAFIHIPEEDMPAFIGRKGAAVNEFAAKHGVEVQNMRSARGSIRITGDEDAVTAAKAAVEEWMKEREQSRKDANISEKMTVRRDQIPAVIGTKGATIRLIQDEFGCRIDVDRDAAIVSVSGGNEEKRAATIAKIKEILAKEMEAKEASGDEAEPSKPKAATPRRERKPQQKTPERKGKSEEPQRQVQSPIQATDFPELTPGAVPSTAAKTGPSWATVV